MLNKIYADSLSEIPEIRLRISNPKCSVKITVLNPKTVKTISVTDSKSVYGFRCIYAAVKITVFHRKCESSNAFLTLYHAKNREKMPSKSVILSVKCQFTPSQIRVFGPDLDSRASKLVAGLVFRVMVTGY